MGIRELQTGPVTLALSERQLILKAEAYVANGEMNYVQAICEICREYQIDPEDIAEMIKGPLKERLEVEAITLGIIKSNTATLF